VPKLSSTELSGAKAAIPIVWRLLATAVAYPPVVEACLLTNWPKSVSSKYTREPSLTIVESVLFGFPSSVSCLTSSTTGADEEQRNLVEACGAEPDFQRLVRAALYAGARYGELGRLRVGDFNERASTLFVAQSKSGKERHIHIDPEAAKFFKEICARRSHSETMLLRDGDAQWEKDCQKKMMRRACKRAKIRKLGFHQLRHSAASRWIMLGVDLKTVSEQLGHTDLRMVSRHYAHLAASHKAATFKALPGAGLDEAAKVKAGNVIALPRRQKL
jgi:Phage integrase family